MSSFPGLSNDFGAIAGSIVGIVVLILILVILRHCYFPSPSLSPLNSPSPPASSPSTAAMHGRISSIFQLRRRPDTENRGVTGAALSERRLKSARPSAATRLGRFVASASNRVPSNPSANSPVHGSNESSETVVHRFSFRDNSHRPYNTGFHFISSRRSQRIGAEERLLWSDLMECDGILLESIDIIQSSSVQPNLTKSNALWFNLIQLIYVNSAQFNWFNAIQTSWIQFNSKQYDSTQFNPLQRNSIQLNSI